MESGLEGDMWRDLLKVVSDIKGGTARGPHLVVCGFVVPFRVKGNRLPCLVVGLLHDFQAAVLPQKSEALHFVPPYLVPTLDISHLP